jgi:hypothetical protein
MVKFSRGVIEIRSRCSAVRRLVDRSIAVQLAQSVLALKLSPAFGNIVHQVGAAAFTRGF